MLGAVLTDPATMLAAVIPTPITVLAAVKPGPLAVGALLLAALAWRWRRMSKENRALAIVAVAGLAVYGSGVVPTPNLEELIKGVGETLGPYTYVLVGVMAFLETGAFVGLVAPGEFTVILGGVVAGQGRISVVLLIGLVWLCAVGGDTTSYFLGRKLGRDFMLKHGPRVKITRDRLEQVEGFFEHHGGKTILFGRFIGLVRAIAPFIAGASRMPFGRFIPYDVVSAGAWSATFCLLGYAFWQSFDRVVTLAKRGAFALGAVIAVVVGAIALYRYLRVPEHRRQARSWVDEQAQRPAVRPLAAVVRPRYARVLAPVGRALAGPARFVWERVTPGELGLEVTTLLAVALVGGYVFGGLAADVSASHPFLADGRAFAVLGGLRFGSSVDVVTAITALGSPVVVGALLGVAVAALLVRREVLEALTLAVGAGLVEVGVHIAKAAEHRPRPAGPLTEAAGFSFPSGHAAYSMAYVAVAVAVVHVLPSFAYRVGVVVVALVLTAAIGLSRVFLRVHYLSDVLAGWGLGAAVFAGCGLVAVVVAFFRNNGARS